MSAYIIFSAYYKLISTAFGRKSLKVYRLNIREVRGGEVLGPTWRKFMGWREWVGRVGVWW